MGHDVVRDYPAYGGMHHRLTCRTCNNDTMVKQPYMSLKRDWLPLLQDWAAQHPSPASTAEVSAVQAQIDYKQKSPW